MTPEEKAELARAITHQFNLALSGERPIFCGRCGRPFRCRETTKFGDQFRTVKPFRHAVRSKHSRELCPGSHDHALLMNPGDMPI